MRLIRRFSYPLLSLLLLVVLGVLAWQLKWQLAGYVSVLVLAAVLVIYWVSARRGNLTPADPAKKLRRARGGQRPVVLHFYSDYALGCLLRRPFVARVEREYRGRCEFIYVDVGHPEAPALRESLKADLGDWLFFDLSGLLVGQRHSLSAQEMERFLAGASQSS